MKKNTSGYTLVELLVVVMFFGVVIPLNCAIVYVAYHFICKFW